MMDIVKLGRYIFMFSSFPIGSLNSENSAVGFVWPPRGLCFTLLILGYADNFKNRPFIRIFYFSHSKQNYLILFIFITIIPFIL